MEGFKINYISADGNNDTTYFGMPITNIDISDFSQDDMIKMMTKFFNNAHPGCKIVSMEPCKNIPTQKEHQ